MPSTLVDFTAHPFELVLARHEEDIRAAQALRYDVFVKELGADGPGVDHASQLDTDGFDAISDHLLLREQQSGEVVGVYRVLPQARAEAGQGFYTASEYDLSPLLSSGRRLLELGRSCVRADYRASAAMFHLWTGLARYVAMSGADLLFGVASFKGVDVSRHAQVLSLLHHKYLAPPALRPCATPYQQMDLVDAPQIDRKAAMVAMPSLVKSYLRLGGMVGAGAFIDHAFNCIDVCMIMDTEALNTNYARRFTGGALA